MPRRKHLPGEKFRPSAAEMNDWNRAAAQIESGRLGQLQGPGVRRGHSTVLPVRNDSGADRNEFDVVEIDRPVFTRLDNEEEFQYRPTLVGGERIVTRFGSDYSETDPNRIAVLQEPVADSEFARHAIVSGFTPARVYLYDQDDIFAEADPSDSSRLLSRPHTSSAEILWIEDDETANISLGEQWAYVRLSNQHRNSRFTASVSNTGATYLTWSDDAVADQKRFGNTGGYSVPGMGFDYLVVKHPGIYHVGLSVGGSTTALEARVVVFDDGGTEVYETQVSPKTGTAEGSAFQSGFIEVEGSDYRIKVKDVTGTGVVGGEIWITYHGPLVTLTSLQ